jgi:hypothetical protein
MDKEGGNMDGKHTIHVTCFQAPGWLRDTRCGFVLLG